MGAISMRRGVVLGGEGGTERAGWTYLPGEWDEVVLTKAINANFPDEDHFVVIFRENCIVDNV